MKPIPGFESRYSAMEDGKIYSHLTNRFLRAAPCGKNGAYLHVSLGRGNSRNVHELVLLAFVGPRPNGYVARHLDGNGHNNATSNLEWSTQSENLLDKNEHGTMVTGERHHACVVNSADVLSIKRLRAQGKTYQYLSDRFGISTSQAHRIATGKNRKAG